jgi:cysteine desulfuration protein SufE
MSIQEIMATLVAEFSAVSDWEARYKMIIERARRLPPMPSELKVDANQVRGCSSMVWIHASFADGLVSYLADSDAVLVRGLVALLLEVYSGHPPDEILRSPPSFIEELGLNVKLSPNRANGVTAMMRQIMIYALAFTARRAGGAPASPPILPPVPPPAGH